MIDSLPLYPSGCLYPVFKGGKKRTSSGVAKKGQPFTRRFAAGQPEADFPVLLESSGSLKTRCVQTPQTPFPDVSAVRGCVKWQKTDDYFTLCRRF